MRLYEQSIVVAGAGITVATLQNWMGRDLVKLDSLETESDGRRRRRRYSERDIVRLALMAELVEVGFTPSAAGEIANEQTTRPAGFLPEWMGRTRADYFLLIGTLENGSPLTTDKGQRLVTLPELLDVIGGANRKKSDVDREAFIGTFLNLSATVRKVRERMLDAFAADHVADERDQAGSDALNAPADE